MTEVLALQAIAWRRHNTERALSSLEQALVLAEPEGYQRVFLDEGRPMTELLRQLMERNGPARAYASRLLGAPESVALPAENLREPLTGRELEILGLLSAGLSNLEMASRLTVSVGTMKTHVHNLYGKLGATGRTHAIARARELRLI